MVMKKAFTLVELIFVIVIIGVLAAVAVPKFSGLSDNAKISAEMQTASTVQAVIASAHSQWLTSRCTFEWGPNEIASDDSANGLNTHGYPISLGTNLSNVFVKTPKDWTCTGTSCKGPASGTNGVASSKCKADKPCIGKSWTYNATNGTFTLK